MSGRLINWKNDAKYVHVNIEKWNKLVDAYAKNKDFERVYYDDERRYKFVFWFGKYQINAQDEKYPILYVGTPSGNLFRFCVNAIDDDKNITGKIKGYEAFKLVQNIFRAETDKGIEAAFGKVESEFKKFVKPAIIEINDRYAGQNNYGVYKADYSGAYPANACGKLPDAHTAIKIHGTVAPSKDYPFAYYINSGHVAEYRRFDTHDMLKSFYAKYILLNKDQKRRDKYDYKIVNIKPDDDITILMRPSDFELTKTMQKLYNKRKDNDDIKQAMVAFFGYCQSTRYNGGKFAHIVAIVYGRHIKNMIDARGKLIKNNCVPLMFATDSIAWRGKPPEGLCTKEKKLGNFVLEYDNCILRYKACGVYALQDLKTKDIYLIKHQGTQIDITKIKSLRDIDDIKLKYTDINADGKIEIKELKEQ